MAHRSPDKKKAFPQKCLHHLRVFFRVSDETVAPPAPSRRRVGQIIFQIPGMRQSRVPYSGGRPSISILAIHYCMKYMIGSPGIEHSPERGIHEAWHIYWRPHEKNQSGDK